MSAVKRESAGGVRGWRPATEEALYGPSGFYRRPEGPAGHFRTSVHASPLFAGAVARLLCLVDEALAHPAELAFVDMGAGLGELVTGVLKALPAEVASRARGYAVERAARPAGVDHRIEWLSEPPPGVTGLLFANEWLDNVPLDVAEVDAEGTARLVLVREDGTEVLGEPVAGAEAEWLERWWPLTGTPGSPLPLSEAPDGPPLPEDVRLSAAGLQGPAQGLHGQAAEGLRAEIGLPRDAAWATAVASLGRGLAVAVDYAHFAGARPPFGTLTGFREGRETAPVPDGSCDITAHVALDACALPGARLLSQREALGALGVSGERPSLSLASTDPTAYVRALAGAGEAAELTARGGLGDFGWLLQPVGIPNPLPGGEQPST
ncbi:SAM-dependent methyltransferase [Streptomyces sp. ActVer]|uniref:SAM-dependent methyltransferase n=1 Tax=Streptomyces sp. ActVer TaxID=3014558 RepID=UPI0022B2CB28|nr:SAM-dependent methyltransferase [Streptomyces sp. ActVer]MCZ4514357.1 SAM-dependent methyltransferase [Streptomyces sp. ActVer]